MVTPEQATLYQHWCRADAVKYVLFSNPAHGDDLPEELHEAAKTMSQTFRLEVFYALIYVVVEGYTQLRFENRRIDALLERKEYLDLLRRFRNGVFHYQAKPFDGRLFDFMTAEESDTWMKNLYDAFNAFFLETLPIRETLAQMREASTQVAAC